MGNKTYIDSSVIINAIGKDDVLWEKANAALKTGDCDLLISDYVKLEVIPKMRYNKHFAELDSAEAIFAEAETIPSSRLVTLWAQSLAEFFGLAALDALHAASAIIGKADALVTFEKPSKPFFRIPPALLQMVSLYG